MKVKELKVYQSVNFATQQETFFSKAIARMKDVDMEVVDWGIRIRTEKDDVIVSFNNVAYAKPIEEPKTVKAKEAKV